MDAMGKSGYSRFIELGIHNNHISRRGLMTKCPKCKSRAVVNFYSLNEQQCGECGHRWRNSLETRELAIPNNRVKNK